MKSAILWTPDAIRNLRAQKKWSQLRLAEELGVQQQRISEWEQRAPGRAYQEIFTLKFGKPSAKNLRGKDAENKFEVV